jgi:hypothetical protein
MNKDKIFREFLKLIKRDRRFEEWERAGNPPLK